MNAFIFAPNNEFVAKFPFHQANQIQSELAAFLGISGRLPHGCYVEALGDTWTIVSQSPLQLQEGRVALSPSGPAAPPAELLTVTTETLPGHTITGSLGIVSGEAIMGANFFRDIAASLRDIVGGRSTAYENNLRRGRAIALAEMSHDARQLGADAIVGVRFDYETVASGGMFMICTTGTAVTVQKQTDHPL